MRSPGPSNRRISGAGWSLAAFCAGYLLIGSACFAAGGPTPETPLADHATEVLLRTIVQQIADGRIISPSDDNAMQTWQRVLQRDIVTQGAPEVLKALQDFDTYARVRAADEKAAGRVLVAAELTVFADQAGRMTGRVPPLDSPGSSDAASSAAPVGQSGASQSGAGQSGERTVAAAAATEGGLPRMRPAQAASGATTAELPAGATASGAANIALPSASAVRAFAAPTGANGEVVPDARPSAMQLQATEAADETVPATRPAGGMASVAQAVMRMAPQTFGTTPIAVDATGDGGSSARSAGNAPDGAGSDVSHAADTVAEVRTPASSAEPPPAPASATAAGDRAQPAHEAVPVTVAATGQIRAASAGVTVLAAASATGNAGQAVPLASPAPTAAVSDVVPFDRLSGQLQAGSQGPGEAASHGTMVAQIQSKAVPVTGAAATPAAQPAPKGGDAAASLPAAPESATAAFYAERGDAMLAHRDISAARKFYEFAANAGSARAATALARTYDPAFTAQLGEVGLRADPGLAAVWYHKAAELGGGPAQLSQTGDTGK